MKRRHTPFAERVFGPPMAGPEERLQLWLRRYVIGGFILLALLTFFAKELSDALGNAYGLATVCLIVSLLASCAIWLRMKRDADEAHWEATFSSEDRLNG